MACFSSESSVDSPGVLGVKVTAELVGLVGELLFAGSCSLSEWLYPGFFKSFDNVALCETREKACPHQFFDIINRQHTSRVI